MPDASPSSAPASTPNPPPVPQSTIAAELSRVYDEAAAATPAEKAGTPTAISPGQGNVPEARTRGDGGRFASKDGKPDAKAESKPDAKADKSAPDAKADDKLDAKAGDKSDAKPKLEPHPRWKPEMRERFTKLAEADPDTAKWVLERQGETEKLVTQARQAAAHGEKYRGLDDVLTPGRQHRSIAGVDDPTFLRSLVAASDYLAKDPRSGLKMLAEQYGVDLKELADGKPADTQDSPHIRALQQQVAEMQQYIQRQNHGAKVHAMHGALGSIQAFAQAKDASGQLLHPHFEEVVDDVTTVVAAQLQAGQQPDLNAAYEKAIRLNDAVWMKTQASKSEREAKSRSEEEARRIADAKRAGFSVSGSGGGGDVVGNSINDELRRQIEKAYR